MRRNWFPSSILLLSILLILFWQFRHTEAPLARRVFSVGNPNDFSWRNRVTAWQGAGRMMWDKPLAGFGWGQAEEIYGKEYRAARLEESAAVQLNDYLMIGISAGTPALICFVAYLWFAMRRGPVGRGSPLPVIGETASGVARFSPSDAEKEIGAHGVTRPNINQQLPVIAASGALLLLIGFWFDGGLFKLPTCAVFWVLVELARGSRRGNENQTNSGLAGLIGDCSRRHLQLARWQIALRWVAGLLALVALGLTALHLGTPQLAVTESTVVIARKFLVPAQEQQDFEFLVAKPIWSAKPLKALLQHAHLAHYNRSLVNWKLDEQVYREFVLAPEIDPAFDGEMDWRRPFWEYFYPRIRKESSLEAAAEIIGRHLNDVCKRRGDEPHKFISESWRQQAATAESFERISVAALRSVGIPARLSTSNQAEFWTGAEWKPAPRPVVESTSSK